MLNDSIQEYSVQVQDLERELSVGYSPVVGPIIASDCKLIYCLGILECTESESSYAELQLYKTC